MKKITLLLGLLVASISALFAQVPMATEDVMLQAFYWNSHGETKWSQLNSQAKEIAASFDLVWLPPASSAEFGGSSNMGYHPYQWSSLSSSWGNRAQLTTLIKSLHSGNCKVIADIVINHRAGGSEWGNFPTDNFGDYGSYTIPNSCVTKDDEKATSAATDYDYKWNVSGDMWGGYSAARDLAHSKSEVRDAVKGYLKWLKNTIGFDGFRYDLVKGYDPKYTAEYNTAAAPYFSVGEFYQSNYNDLAGWVNGTSKKSTVFDFCFKQAMYNWGGGTDYSKLVWKDGNIDRPAGLIHNPGMRQYAVTFIDNHDTAEPHEGAWELKNNIEQANAVMLSAPGIPCVFWKHWTKHKSAIKQMIATRKAMGVNSNSDVKVTNKSGYYESVATGTKGTLICRIGSWSGTPDGYTVACSGNGWAYYTSKAVNPNPGPGPDDPQPDDPTPDDPTPSQSYAIRVNGTTNYPAEYKGTSSVDSSFEEYMASVQLNEGDTFVTYDLVNKAGWVMEVEPYGEYENFEVGATSVKCKKAGCYDFYIKMKFQADIMYIGPGTNCGNTPLPDDPQPDDPQPDDPQPDDPIGPTPSLEEGYYIRVNGNEYYKANALGTTDMQGREQFMASVPLKAGDKFQCYDGASGAAWSIVTLEPYGVYANFTAAATYSDEMVCNVDGCYDLYIKLMYEDDTMYIGEGTDCSAKPIKPDPTDIIEAEAVELNIYPNPTNDYINIDCAEDVEQVVISALNGSEVIRTKSNEIDLSSLTPSMYFVNVMLQNGDVVVSKVIRK